MPYYTATFPGVERVLSCSYTRSHGISPGVATLEIVPQTFLVAPAGTLSFVDLETGAFVSIPGCKVDRGSIRTGEDGQKVTLQLWDRRWKWAFGHISGKYNFKFREGPPRLDPAFERTPQELAALCLDAMGEAGYDVSQLPNDSRPEVDWDVENPAQALSSLVENLGCRVVLKLNNTVQICLLGVGNALPPGNGLWGPLEDSLSIDPPERPDSLVVVGKALFQHDFVLEAVGEDLDGSIKPIDDLTYKPATGWETTSPPNFGKVSGEKDRELARKTVWRWYRVKVTDEEDQPTELPGSGLLMHSLEQILPLTDKQVDEVEDLDFGKFAKRDALPFGVHAKPGIMGFANFPATADYAGEYSIDTERGIVQFSDYVFIWEAVTEGYHRLPADLKLRVAVSIRDPATWGWLRFFRAVLYQGGTFGTGPRILKHDEIVAEYIDGVPQNLPEAIAEADHYIAGADQEYQVALPQERTYTGLLPIDPDGAIQQVTWQFAYQGPMTTTASRNTEHAVNVQPYPIRRVWDFLRGGGAKLIKDTIGRIRAESESEGQ